MIAIWSHPSVSRNAHSLAQGDPTFKLFFGGENSEEAGLVAPKGALKSIEE